MFRLEDKEKEWRAKYGDEAFERYRKFRDHAKQLQEAAAEKRHVEQEAKNEAMCLWEEGRPERELADKLKFQIYWRKTLLVLFCIALFLTPPFGWIFLIILFRKHD